MSYFIFLYRDIFLEMPRILNLQHHLLVEYIQHHNLIQIKVLEAEAIHKICILAVNLCQKTH